MAATTSSQANIPTTVNHLWTPSAFQSGPRLPAFYPRANSRPDQSEPQPTLARSPSSQAYPIPLLQAHQHPDQPQPGHRPARLTPQPALPGHPHACSQILTFRPLPIKPYVIFIGKGRFCLYLCHACICAMPVFMALPVFALPVNTNIPGTHQGAPGISVKDQSVHLMILVTRPEPTVRPPSRIAKPRPSSMAMGWIS